MYTLEDTKNMSRALRHDDFDTFISLLKTDERFTPWLDSYKSNLFLDILFGWIDANFIDTPENDVEAVFISAVADKLLDNREWDAAFACLTCLPDSPKAQKKRAQALNSYVQSTPDCSIELAFHKRAVNYYNENTSIDEELRNDAKIYHELALQHFDIEKLRAAMKGRVVEGREVKTHLAAIAALLFAIDKKNWLQIQTAAQRLSHPLSADDAFAWLSWFADCINNGADHDEINVILAWSDLFWPLIRDPLLLRDRVHALYPESAQILDTRETPKTIHSLSKTASDALPQTALLRAMLADDARMVTQHSDAIDTLHPVVSSLLAAWLNIMDAPEQLSQTIRASLKQHPSFLNLYALALAHDCVPQNDKLNFIKELFPLGDNAVCLLNAFKPLALKALNSVQRTYLVDCLSDSAAPIEHTPQIEQESTKLQNVIGQNDIIPSNNSLAINKQSYALKPRSKTPLILLSAVVIIIVTVIIIMML